MEKLISNNFKKGGYNGISFNFAWNIYITNNNTDFNNIINITKFIYFFIIFFSSFRSCIPRTKSQSS